MKKLTKAEYAAVRELYRFAQQLITEMGDCFFCTGNAFAHDTTCPLRVTDGVLSRRKPVLLVMLDTPYIQ